MAKSGFTAKPDDHQPDVGVPGMLFSSKSIGLLKHYIQSPHKPPQRQKDIEDK